MGGGYTVMSHRRRIAQIAHSAAQNAPPPIPPARSGPSPDLASTAQRDSCLAIPATDLLDQLQELHDAGECPDAALDGIAAKAARIPAQFSDRVLHPSRNGSWSRRRPAVLQSPPASANPSTAAMRGFFRR